MDEAEREQLKEKLRAKLGNGIDLDSADQWVVEGLEEPKKFFHCLLHPVPQDTTLYFEGVDIAPEVAHFFETNREQNPVTVSRDTISPTPDVFHVVLTSELIYGLSELLDRYPQWDCFEIVKAYRNGKLLLDFHDAFGGDDLLIADWVPETQIRAFCNCLGVAYRRERNVRWTLENLDR